MTARLVLLVDDDEDVRSSTCLLLETLGYHVLEAEGVTTALEILRREPSVALLFTDLRLGGNESGFELAEKAKLVQPELKILFASGSPAPEHSSEHPMIRKPYRLDDLGRMIEQVLA